MNFGKSISFYEILSPASKLNICVLAIFLRKLKTVKMFQNLFELNIEFKIEDSGLRAILFFLIALLNTP